MIVDHNFKRKEKEDDFKEYIDEILEKLNIHQKEKEKSLVTTHSKVTTYNPDLEFEVM